MKWVTSEADAREARDVSIECMARISATAAWVKASVADDAYFVTYRRACGMLTGELGEIINRAGFDVPHLVPREEGMWEQITAERVAPADLAARTTNAAELRAVLEYVQRRVGAIHDRSPLIIGATMGRYIRELEAAINGWPG